MEKNMNKKGLIEYLKGVNVADLSKKDKSLGDRVKYTVTKAVESAKNVGTKDLQDLVDEVVSFLVPKQEVLPIENAIKLATKSQPKVSEEEISELVDDIIGDEEEEPIKAKKSKEKTQKTKSTSKVSKPIQKVVAKKEPIVTTEENVSPQQTILAKQFKEEFTSDAGNLKINFNIKNIEDLRKLIDEGNEFIFAMYWNKRHLAQFNYDTMGIGTKVKEFKDDLDLCKPLYITENGILYVISLYTEVMYLIRPEELEISEGMRFSQGVEFNIYEVDIKETK